MNYYDHSRADPTQTGVRNSFVTAEIVELGQKYPPAREALIIRRDVREHKILTNSATRDDEKEWYSINTYLRDTARTSRVLLELQSEHLPAAELVLSVVKKFSND